MSLTPAPGEVLADLQLATRLQALAMRLVPRAERDILLRDILATGADILGATRSQLLAFDAEGHRLRPAVLLGMSEGFVAHFERRGWAAVCDAAAACSPRPSPGSDASTLPGEDRAMLVGDGIAEIHSAPLLSRDGRLLGLLSHCFAAPRPLQRRELHGLEALARMAADCLERGDIEQSQRDADRHKDEFLATLAHELRNPLAPMRNAIELLRRGRAGDPGAVAHLLDRQVGQVARLVDDLCDLGRVARGQVELRRHRQPLQAIVAQAVECATPLLRSTGQALVLRQPHEPLWVDADAQRLAQALTNLLHNACKYAEPGAGAAELSVAHEPAQAVVRLRDHGIGIAAEQLPRIFDMYVQVDSPQRRAHAGLGIGLTLVRRFVQLHGGTIEASSEGPGRGSEFIVRLPLAACA